MALVARGRSLPASKGCVTARSAFTFGENWLNFSRLLDEQRVQEAMTSLMALLAVPDLRELTFVDVGAGSGLFSIAAVRLGAVRVLALDRDANCLKAIQDNARRFLSPTDASRLECRLADILEPTSVPLERFDVVYAWGSLHHTGAMWDAIRNTAPLCGPRGRFVLALYNETRFSPYWLSAKRFYHGAPAPMRGLLVAMLAGPRILVRALKGRRVARTGRAMSVWYDAVDWLGGLPYEWAAPSQVGQCLERLGFRLERSLLTKRHGCNEFVFVRQTPTA
jgi:SAM-dependent methyltransferase